MTHNFSTLIGLLYNGPMEENPWQGFAAGMRVALKARNVAITLHHATATDHRSDIYVMDSDPEDRTDWSAVEATYRAEFMESDAFRYDRMTHGELGIIDFDKGHPKKPAFLESLDIGHCLRVCIAEPGGLRCTFDIIRSRQHPDHPYAAADLELVRALLPHMTRALRLYAKLKWEEVEKAIYKGMVDHFGLGCVLLNEAGAVIHVNGMAESLIARWPHISVSNGRLRLTERSAQGTLNNAIQSIGLARQQENANHGGELVHLQNSDGKLFGLLVYPAPLQHYYRSAQTASIIVYLSELTANLEAMHPSQAYSLRRIGQLFNLTPQESALALLLAYGHTLVEAAHEMQIAETAARNYSKRIYAKIGIKSQADLVRLMLRSFSFLR